MYYRMRKDLFNLPCAFFIYNKFTSYGLPWLLRTCIVLNNRLLENDFFLLD